MFDFEAEKLPTESVLHTPWSDLDFPFVDGLKQNIRLGLKRVEKASEFCLWDRQNVDKWKIVLEGVHSINSPVTEDRAKLEALMMVSNGRFKGIIYN